MSKEKESTTQAFMWSHVVGSLWWLIDIDRFIVKSESWWVLFQKLYYLVSIVISCMKGNHGRKFGNILRALCEQVWVRLKPCKACASFQLCWKESLMKFPSGCMSWHQPCELTKSGHVPCQIHEPSLPSQALGRSFCFCFFFFSIRALATAKGAQYACQLWTTKALLFWSRDTMVIWGKGNSPTGMASANLSLVY